MSEEPWRPLGVDEEDEVAEYDALHDGVPIWMSSAYWAWVKDAISTKASYTVGSGYNNRQVPYFKLNVTLVEELSQTLRIGLPNLRGEQGGPSEGSKRIASALATLQGHTAWLQIADYLLANGHGKASELEDLLTRSKSAFTVGTRSGKPGLVRRVPLGVQVAGDSVMARSGRAGVRLAKAWGELYGLKPNASEAYRLAILAVEDASVPVVSPKATGATLGTVLKQMEDQGDWGLPMDREHTNAPSSEVLVSMMRMLWHGQHDRHGGQPSAPGNVSEDEAKVAVSLAVTLVNLFESGLIKRSAKP